jgi:hypothetical protein
VDEQITGVHGARARKEFSGEQVFTGALPKVPGPNVSGGRQHQCWATTAEGRGSSTHWVSVNSATLVPIMPPLCPHAGPSHSGMTAAYARYRALLDVRSTTVSGELAFRSH